MSKSDGGPAFPQKREAMPWDKPGNSKAITGGMTLRDYFAAKALATVSAYAAEDVATWGTEDFAKHAYAIADAMLAARNA